MPTIKQKKAFDKAVENGGNVSKAMRESRYSKAMAKNPQKLTNSKGWNELMDQYLSDSKLAKVHADGLEAMRIHGTGDDFIEIPDYATRHKYLDTGYKLKGKLVDKKVNMNVNIAEVLNQLNEKKRLEERGGEEQEQ